MAVRTRDHEPPAVPAFVAVVLGGVTAYLGVVIPSESMVRHVLLCAVFGLVALASGWRTLAIARRRIAPRIWAWVGIVLGGAGLVSLVWQLLAMWTAGAVPPPPWAPFARH